MEKNIYICPNCGHKFEQGEYEYNYNSGMLDFNCPDCDWSGNDVIDEAKVENDLYDKLENYGLEGVEITDEDVKNVFERITEYGDTYEDALNDVLKGIKECLE